MAGAFLALAAASGSDAAPPERILKAKVLRTVMDGRDTFRVPEP